MEGYRPSQLQKPPESNITHISEKHRWDLISQNLKTWYLSWPTASNNSTNLFLSSPATLLTPERATISDDANPAQERIDQILDYYRHQKKSSQEILIWYLSSSPSDRLDAKLLARGVGFGWKFEWMWCDLSASSPTSSTTSLVGEDIKIETHPVENSEISSSFSHRYVLTAYATTQSIGIGSVTLNLTPECNEVEEKEHVVAGLFNMTVLPTYRKRGIGTALALAARNLARELGCKFLYLNATALGKPVYERVGFETIGMGHVWRLDRRTCRGFYEEKPPSGDVVRFLEAVCLGDVDALEKLEGRMDVEGLQRPTRNGMTPLEIAVHFGQRGSAEWLVENGVVGDVLSLWDLGWKERARAFVRERPDQVHVLEGRSGRRPLDVALERDDQDLAALLAGVTPRVESKKVVELDLAAIDWEKYFDSDVESVGEVEELVPVVS